MPDKTMTINDNTKRIIFTILAVILLLSVILPLFMTRFEHNGIQPRQGSDLWWTLRIRRFVSTLTLVFWLALFLYEDWLRSRIDTVVLVARMKTIVFIMCLLIIAILILLGIEFVTTLYIGSRGIILDSIKLVLFGLFFGYFLMNNLQTLKYLRTHSASVVIAASLRERSDKFIKSRDFDKAYAALLKACETVPDGLWLWCELSLFCERFRQNSAEADNYIAKAGELIATNKANSVKDNACYLNYLGLILCVRGEHGKGLEYIKQAIDIEPKPYRIEIYEELLADSKSVQSGATNKEIS